MTSAAQMSVSVLDANPKLRIVIFSAPSQPTRHASSSQLADPVVESLDG
jgi:hypothetical protein